MLRLVVLSLAGLAFVPTSALLPEGADAPPQPPFCQRNPHTCSAAGEIYDGVRIKASLALDLAIRTFDAESWDIERVRADAGSSMRGTVFDDAGPVPRGNGDAEHSDLLPPKIDELLRQVPKLRPGTLTETDRAPRWRGN